MGYNFFMRMRKKKWVKPFLDDEKDYLIDKIDLDHINKEIYLEIGMGMGDFIVESAKNNPDIFYIGLEKDETCVARSIIKAKDNQLNNLKIMLDNADNIEELFKEDCLSGIYLFFSDPWPKTRNHKKRLTYPTFLKKYYKILKKDGFLIFKTDNDSFFLDTLEYINESDFIVVESTRDYHSIERNDILTGYERKFKEEGKNINYLKLIK